MVRNLKGTLIAGLFMMLGFGSLMSAEYKLESFRSVVGAGGMVEEASAKGTYVVSGVVSQAVIEDRNSTNYFVKQGFWNEIISSVSVDDVVIKNNGLSNYPNPIKDYTKIQFELPAEAYVTVKIFDVAGNLIATIYDDYKNAGTASVDWRATDNFGSRIASGNYVCEVSARPAMVNGPEAFQAFATRKVLTVVN